MTNRTAQLNAFIHASEFSDWERHSMTGDASSRRYERLKNPKTAKTVILMDAPPDKGEDIRPFVKVAQFLTQCGLCAPKIYNSDAENGFLLLEDLGPDLFAAVMQNDAETQIPLYTAAVDVLIELSKFEPPSDLSSYSVPVMTDLAMLAFDWYSGGADHNVSTSQIETLSSGLEQVFSAHANDTSVLIQRDYQSENLIWRPDETGFARVGLLDFQDAVKGHPAYDLVSILEDARRDVPKTIQDQMINYYIKKSGFDDETFRASYAVLGAQRNLRILAVFARLSLKYSKPNYIKLIPRVWGYLMQDLAHPALKDVKDDILKALPYPSPEVLNRLIEKCGTRSFQ